MTRALAILALTLCAPLVAQRATTGTQTQSAEQAEQVVASLEARDADVEFLRFPDEGHSIRKRPNRVAYYRALSGFLEDQLKRQNSDVGD